MKHSEDMSILQNYATGRVLEYSEVIHYCRMLESPLTFERYGSYDLEGECFYEVRPFQVNHESITCKNGGKLFANNGASGGRGLD